MNMNDPPMRKRFLEIAEDGRITCKDCLRLARELDIPTREIAPALAGMNIKITSCQLGCFE